MFGRLVRMRADILVSILLSIITAFIVSGVIDIDRSYYQKAVAGDRAGDLAGYPATAQTLRAASIEQIKAASAFTLDLSQCHLTPTGKYRRLAGGKYARNRFSVWVEAVRGEAYGQFYIAELPSQERIVILVDDQVVSVKDQTAPFVVGNVEKTVPSAIFKELKEQYQLTEANWFADMAGNHWRTSELGKTAAARRSTLWLVTLVGTFVGLQLLIHLLLFRLLKK